MVNVEFFAQDIQSDVRSCGVVFHLTLDVGLLVVQIHVHVKCDLLLIKTAGTLNMEFELLVDRVNQKIEITLIAQ